MIGFTPPIYEEVIPGVRMAVFTVSDTPGSQYVYRNRDIQWFRELLSLYADNPRLSPLRGDVHVTNYHGLGPLREHMRSVESLARWWIGQKDVYPFSSTGEGALIRVAKKRRTWRMPGDLFVFVMILGSSLATGKWGYKPCPLYSYWYHGFPRKNRRRRKWEVRQREEWAYKGWAARLGREPPWPYETDLYRNVYSPLTEEHRQFRLLLENEV